MKKVRSITMDELDNLGLDDENNLYWKNNPIIIRKRIELTKLQRFFAVSASMAIFLASMATVGSFVISFFEFQSNCNPKIVSNP